jgi:glycerophosphoryl diester phosphodiesterase
LSRSPELIGHRGAPRERPENTIASFLRAIDLGADAIELDVHATRDGVVVVHHDFLVQERPITDLTAAEVAAIRVSGEPIPTLADVLDTVGSRATVYVELKGRAIEQRVIAALARSSTAHTVPIHSFDHRAVARARALQPTLTGGILLVSYLVEPERALRAAGARDYWQEWTMIDENLVRTIHAAAGRVIAWTVNDPDQARRLVALGVDGICTDQLQLIGPAVGRAP